jgi:uncharacterized lipoprotein YmbA
MRIVAVCLCVLLAACGSVAVPEQHYYRLVPPSPAGELLPRAGTLRVANVELAAELSGDRMLVADGPVRVAPFVHHHWAGPLDRLVADALVTGLRRAGWFERVKDLTTGGGEDWLITARVLDFHLAPGSDGEWVGLATIDLELVDQGGTLVFRDEFRRTTPTGGTEPEYVVEALSRSVESIVADFGVRCERAGVFEQSYVASPWR